MAQKEFNISAKDFHPAVVAAVYLTDNDLIPSDAEELRVQLKELGDLVFKRQLELYPGATYCDSDKVTKQILSRFFRGFAAFERQIEVYKAEAAIDGRHDHTRKNGVICAMAENYICPK